MGRGRGTEGARNGARGGRGQKRRGTVWGQGAGGIGRGEGQGGDRGRERGVAKNLYHKEAPTMTGRMVKEFQELCPNARVVYCSATPCSEPMNMGYMTRLGLWGEGTQFEDFQAFLKDIGKRGVGAMELVAMQLKAEGRLVSRSLSFAGCEFSLVPLVNRKDQIDAYNTAVHSWQLLWQVFHDAAEEDSLYTLLEEEEEDQKNGCGCGPEGPRQKVGVTDGGELVLEDEGNPKEDDPDEILDDVGGIKIKRMPLSRMRALYWAAHQRFFRSMCVAFKVDKAVEITKKALADDMCVVIGLQSTTRRHGAGRSSVSQRPGGDLEALRGNSNASGGNPPAPASLFDSPPPVPVEIGDDEDIDVIDIDGSEPSPTPPLSPPPPPVPVTAGPGEVVDLSFDEPTEAGFGGGWGAGVKAEPGFVVKNEASGGRAAGSGGAGSGEAGTRPAVLPGPGIISFTPEEDDLLWGDGVTKFAKAKSRLLAWLDRVYLLPLPTPPLDDLMDKLGGIDAVAEMTGRRERMVRCPKGGVFQERRDANNTAGPQEQNNYERMQFNEGLKKIAIISDAASAGVSLHANRVYPMNQRRRMHITVELPWSADKAIQQLGRTHRANQFHAPMYSLLMSEVCGETRFAAAVAKRLESLGALTQGDRRASHAGSGELGFTAFNVDNQYGKASLNHIYRLCVYKEEKPVVQPPDLADEECEHIREEVVQTRRAAQEQGDYVNLSESRATSKRKSRENLVKLSDANVTFFEAVVVWLSKVDIEVATRTKEDRIVVNKLVKGDVGRFLNRILGLRIVQQHVLFDYFHNVLEHHVKEAKRDGTYEDGIGSLTGASCEVSFMKALELLEKTGLRKGEVEALKVTIDQSVTFEQVHPKYVFAMEETKRREDLARRMLEERRAAGNKIRTWGGPVSKTGFMKRCCPRYKVVQVVLVIDYPGRITSGFNTGNSRPLTVWFPCNGRAEINRRLFGKRGFSSISSEEAGLLWDKEMVRDKSPRCEYVLRGPRLLMAWPYLDQTFFSMFPSLTLAVLVAVAAATVTAVHVHEKKKNVIGSTVTHVKPFSPHDAMMADAYHLLMDDDEDEWGMSSQEKDKNKEPFIALKLPRRQNFGERDAMDFFEALEKGTFIRFRSDGSVLESRGGPTGRRRRRDAALALAHSGRAGGAAAGGSLSRSQELANQLQKVIDALTGR
eukprot:jgi/Undpi1/6945/HiC_scaffold_21.g09419.m1